MGRWKHRFKIDNEVSRCYTERRGLHAEVISVAYAERDNTKMLEQKFII